MSEPRIKQSEKYIEKHLARAVESAGGRSVKMALTGSRGFPDRLNLLPRARTVFVEVKGTGKPLDALQRVWRDRIRALGHEWYLLDHTDDIPGILSGENKPK